MKDLREYKGHTFYIGFGDSIGRIKLEWNDTAKRLVIFRFCIGITHFDAEVAFSELIKNFQEVLTDKKPKE